MSANSTIINNLRFPGQYFDSETKENYNYFRDYNPARGTYRQEDPIGLNGGINIYGYAFNNPNVYIDPEGKFVVFLPLAFTLAQAGWAAYQSYQSTLAFRKAQCENDPFAGELPEEQAVIDKQKQGRGYRTFCEWC